MGPPHKVFGLVSLKLRYLLRLLKALLRWRHRVILAHFDMNERPVDPAIVLVVESLFGWQWVVRETLGKIQPVASDRFVRYFVNAGLSVEAVSVLLEDESSQKKGCHWEVDILNPRARKSRNLEFGA
jgi:hypothetical protein